MIAPFTTKEVSVSEDKVINTGGPAYPSLKPKDPEDPSVTFQEGMTLRDWLAGQVLAGESVNDAEGDGWQESHYGALADRCYAIADAMIKARGM